MIRRIVAISAALVCMPLFAALADEVGGEEIVVPMQTTQKKPEEVVVVSEKPVSLPPPGVTRESVKAREKAQAADEANR